LVQFSDQNDVPGPHGDDWSLPRPIESGNPSLNKLVIAAFGKIIDSLVGDIIMPIIGALTGGLEFSNHFLGLSKAVNSPVLAEAKKRGAVLGWAIS
jgi:hypothetical protein